LSLTKPTLETGFMHQAPGIHKWQAEAEAEAFFDLWRVVPDPPVYLGASQLRRAAVAS
jgi:hypothetical protein